VRSNDPDGFPSHGPAHTALWQRGSSNGEANAADLDHIGPDGLSGRDGVGTE
jgi:hypothetical protein